MRICVGVLGIVNDNSIVILQINVDHLDVKDLMDMSLARTNIPLLILSIEDRWIQRFPLLSEIDLLNKTFVLYFFSSFKTKKAQFKV